MKNLRLPKVIIFGLFATALVLGVFSAVPASAQASNTNAAQGIEVSPALVELNATRGGTYDITLHIRNVTNTDLVYNASIADFTASGETGSPHIENSGQPANISLRTWVNTIPQFTVAAQQLRVVNAQIVVPNNAEPGGHYGVIQFSGTAPEIKSTGVGLSASAGVLLLIKVDGNIVEKADLASFYTANGGNQTFFFENSPITFVTRIKNEGNIHVKPVGNIEVRDMFGGLVANLPVNKSSSNVLPYSIRRFDESLNKQWMFGLYTANFAMPYGTHGSLITSTTTFWVIPYKLILLTILLLVILFLVLSRLIKVYNRRIIEKHKNENKKTKANKGKKKD